MKLNAFLTKDNFKCFTNHIFRDVHKGFLDIQFVALVIGFKLRRRAGLFTSTKTNEIFKPAIKN